MAVKHIPCGPFANFSEESATDQLKILLGKSTNRPWVLLTNHAFAWNAQSQPDEIDLIAIGPPGVQIVEIKHWRRNYVESPDRQLLVDGEINKLINKVKKVSTRLKALFPKLGYMHGKFLLTREETAIGDVNRLQKLGVRFYVTREWKSLLDFDKPNLLTDAEIEKIAKEFGPGIDLAVSGDLRRLGEIVIHDLLTPKAERFHRIYRGHRARSQEKVFLHLYDISAISDKAAAKQAEDIAAREYETLQRLQKLQTLPSLMDSFQDVPNYPGELKFYSILDPAAPNVEERRDDATWTIDHRRLFTIRAMDALHEFHCSSTTEQPIVHRNLTPRTVRVRPGATQGADQPLFTGLHRTRLPEAITIGSHLILPPEDQPYAAPEVVKQGLSAADQRSDIYSLCATLLLLFEGDYEDPALRETLQRGLMEKPEARPSLDELVKLLERDVIDAAPPPAQLPPPHLWCEDLVIPFKQASYRILNKLGSGSFGTTFKVVKEDPETFEQFGIFVAKVLHDGPEVERILKSYRVVQTKITGNNLSVLYDITSDSRENTFHALLGWVEGERLDYLRGELSLYAEMVDSEPEEMILDWMESLLTALRRLHQAKMTHGDVSGKNLIVNQAEITLIDYDLVCALGEKPISPGTLSYAAPGAESVARASNDVYALAATLFQAVFDREPFFHGGEIRKERGLNWTDLPCDRWPRFVKMADFATSPDEAHRPKDASEALAKLKQIREELPSKSVQSTSASDAQPPSVPLPRPEPEFADREVPWLKTILRMYPGRWGNDETRGLDTDFARDTYVETDLEIRLRDAINGEQVRLILFCGNAGDGKTAMIQHLLNSLGQKRRESRDRAWEEQLPNGPTVRVNLDGSAAWQGRTALDLLDEFFEPFQQNTPVTSLHLLAVNDGKLLEWIESWEARRGATPFTRMLANALFQKTELPAWLRFINFNDRSLVGGLNPHQGNLSQDFLDRLLDRMLGGSRVGEIWSPCETCNARTRCDANRSVQMLRKDDPRSTLIRQQLAAALQAVHQQGRFHITTRDLRAALSYIFFGLNYCTDLHQVETASLAGEQDDTIRNPGHYFDRAFDSQAPSRQGELLKALAYFDPAMDSHPKIDRHLVANLETDPTRSIERQLDSARRRAYFEWSTADLQDLGLNRQDLGLARRTHNDQFRTFPLLTESERKQLGRKLCEGIARLEELPEVAHRRPALALKITPRTPTESAFWVEKTFDDFELIAEQATVPEGMETLHTHLMLRYRHSSGIEVLRVNIDLFELLMDLAEGLQIVDASSDDLFANLAIFKQRLTLEEQRTIYAWNPAEVKTVMQLRVSDPPAQTLVLERLIATSDGGQHHG